VDEISPTVFIVDDEARVRKGLSRLLRAEGLCVEEYASAELFLTRKKFEGIGCLVLDYQMMGLTGLDLQRRLEEVGDPIPIIFLSGHGDIATSVTAMKEGAVDFLTKPVDATDLLKAVRRSFKRHEEALARRGDVETARRRCETLTPRELDVMRCVITGALNKQIAQFLGITLKTVKVHRGRVMQKMGVESVADLVRLCDDAGIEPFDAV
jgi:FixJ family two-component response regulator